MLHCYGPVIRGFLSRQFYRDPMETIESLKNNYLLPSFVNLKHGTSRRSLAGGDITRPFVSPFIGYLIAMTRSGNGTSPAKGINVS